MTPRIGSLFSGYGGLTLATEAVFGGTTAWHCEVDPAPSKILDARWPGVPNLGDITSVDWSTVEPVDVLDGGSPCQDVSAAGKRAGMRAGTRSGLWASMCDAIDVLRPGVVVWENVRGVLSAEADSALEPCPGCVGDGDDGAVLRALGRVLGDLADLGYDASWYGLRAADVGAPHGRYRIFVAATDASHVGHERRRPARYGGTGPTDSRLTPTDAYGSGLQGPRPSGRGQERPEPLGHLDPAADPDSDALRVEPVPQPGGSRPTVAGHAGGFAPADAGGGGRRQDDPRGRDLVGQCGIQARRDEGAGTHRPDSDSAGTSWGQYEPAIRRWERALGWVAPAPTELAPKGGQRLSPRFVEFMMGLPAGWVTDVPISRNEQLKALGNGVVPQQAAAALAVLLPHLSAVAA